MTVDKRFIIDNGCVRDILGFIEPIPVISSHQAIKICNVLNGNWSEFNKLKCMNKRLRNQNKRLCRINGELHHRVGHTNVIQKS